MFPQIHLTKETWALQSNQSFPLCLSTNADMDLSQEGGAFSHPHKPGDRISAPANSPYLNSEFEWSEQLPPLPQTCPALGGIPIEEEIHHFLWSSPSGEVGLWPAELEVCLWDFSRTEEKLLLEKILCPWAAHPEGKIKNEHSQIFVAFSSILFCMLGQ